MNLNMMVSPGECWNQQSPESIAQLLVTAHVVLFADFQTIVPQQVIGGGDMKEKLRQTIGQNIGPAAEFLFFRCSRAQNNFQCFATFKLCFAQAVKNLDAKEARRAVHTLKSNVRHVGLTRVAEFAEKLENLARDEQFELLQESVAQVEQLASAVANAVNNDSQDAEELFVIACFADEGPTLRRFRPRARGRATRINKRTCHITVIVARMSDDRLAVVQGRRERQGGSAASGRPQSSASSRRARVERSRKGAAAEQPTVDEVADAPADETVETTAAVAPVENPDGGEIVAGEWPGSAEPLEDGEMPEGYEIKGNAQSMLYHEPGSRYYKATKAEVWFDSVESAEAAGFSKPGAKEEEAADADNTDDAAADEAEES